MSDVKVYNCNMNCAKVEKLSEELKQQANLHALAVARFRAGEALISECDGKLALVGGTFNSFRELQAAIAAYDAAVNKTGGEKR